MADDMPNLGIGDDGPRKKVLPMFFLVDISGSMYGNRIASVNNAMNTLVPLLKNVKSSKKNRNLDIQIRVITFGQGDVQWKCGSLTRGVSAEQYTWVDFASSDCGGGTPTAEAINEVLRCVNDNGYKEYLGGYIATPFMLLISDGDSNSEAAFISAVNNLQATKVGKAANMVAIGIETENNPRATNELSKFGKNGFKHCTDADLDKVSLNVVTATMRSIKCADTMCVDGEKNTENIFEDDDDDIL